MRTGSVDEIYHETEGKHKERLRNVWDKVYNWVRTKPDRTRAYSDIPGSVSKEAPARWGRGIMQA